MDSVLRILYIDDDLFSARLIEHTLATHAFPCSLTIVVTKAEYLAALARGGYDVILSDYRMPGFDGDEALAAARERHPDVPFILVTGELGEEFVIERLKKGVTDYVLKDNLKRLVPAIERAVKDAGELGRRRRVEEALRASEERYATTLKSIGDAVIATDEAGRVTFLNGVAETLTGWTLTDAAGRSIEEVFRVVREEDGEPVDNPVMRVLKAGETVGLANHAMLVRRDGTRVAIDDSGAPIRGRDGALAGVVLVFRDITERRRVEAELARAHRDLEVRVRERTAELQQTVVALGAERRRFHEVLDALPAYVILLSPDYHVPFANRFFRERFGEAKGRRCYEYLFGRSEPCEICETYTVLKTGKPHEWEWTGPDGRQYQIFDFSFIDTDGSQHILEMGLDVTERKVIEAELAQHRVDLEGLVNTRTQELGTMNRRLQAEIAERKHAEETLRQSEERYRTLFSSMTEGFALHEIVCDAQGEPVDYVFLDVNPAFESLTGLASGAVLGRRVSEVLPGNDPVWVRKYGTVALTGEPMHFEEYSTPLQRYFEVFAYRPAPRQFAVLFIETTTRRQAENALRESREDLQRAQAVARTGSWRLDVRQNALAWSDEACRIFGISAGTPLTYERFLDFVHPDDREHVHGRWSAALHGEVYDIEHRILADGRVKWVRERAELDFDAAGKLVSGFGTVQDITELKWMEESLRAAQEELEARVERRTRELRQANKELESFSYSVSHDLKAPLRAVKGFARMLAEGTEGSRSPQDQECVRVILESTTQMEEIICALMAFSGLSRQVPRLIQVDMQSLVRSVVDHQRQVGGADLGSVRISLGQLPPATADPVLLRQVFANLLSNALKFSRTRPEPMIEIGGCRRGRELVYYIRDNGVGFPQAQAGRLFGMFQRLHHQSEFEGTGIGLANVRKIIERHGGRVWAEGEDGKGAAFYFTLPAPEERAAGAPADTPGTRPDPPGPTRTGDAGS